MNTGGPGPSPAYLAQLTAALQGAPGGTGMPPMTPDAGGGYPALGDLAPPAPAPPPSPPQPWVPQDPLQPSPTSLPTDPVGGYAPPGGPPPGTPGPGEPQGPTGPNYANDVEVRQVGGGPGIPAHEAMNKGPEQLGHYMAAFDSQEGGARSQGLRTQMQASQEDAMYAEQARAAQEREAQANALTARRQMEMQQREDEFRSQIDMLGQQHLDQGRYFASMGTGEKIATTLLLGLGTLTSMGGIVGRNRVADSLNRAVNKDIALQKFDYDAGVTRAKGLQTAYSMLRDRYHDEDIALAGARVAALDYTLAKANGMKAQWKGTEAANDLDAVLGKLGADRENTIGNAMTLVGAQAAGGGNEVWVRDRGGMSKLPGLKTDAEATKIKLEHGVKVNEHTEAERTKGGVALTLEQQKAQDALAKQAAKQKANGKDFGNIYNVDMAFLKKARRDLIESDAPGRKKDIPGSTAAMIPTRSALGGLAPETNKYNIDIEKYNAQLLAMIDLWARDSAGRVVPAQVKKWHEAYDLNSGMMDATKEQRVQGAAEWIQERARAKGVPQAGTVGEAGTADPADDLFEGAP